MLQDTIASDKRALLFDKRVADSRREPNGLVESTDEAARCIQDAAGGVLVEPFDIPVGRLAVAADPFGNVLVLVDVSKGRYTKASDGKVTAVRRDV